MELTIVVTIHLHIKYQSKNYEVVLLPLHNTKYKKELRKQMLNNEKPKECDYCWRVEDSNPESFSDRIMKSVKDGLSLFSWYKKINLLEDVIPSYVEISFSNQCNMDMDIVM